MGSRGVVSSRSRDVSRACSGAGAVVPRRENINRTAFPSVSQKQKRKLLPTTQWSLKDSSPRKSSKTTVQCNSDLSILIAPDPDPASEGSALCGSAPSQPHLLPAHTPLPQWAPRSPAVPGDVGVGTPVLIQACWALFKPVASSGRETLWAGGNPQVNGTARFPGWWTRPWGESGRQKSQTPVLPSTMSSRAALWGLGLFAFCSCPFGGKFFSRSHITWWFFGKLSPSLLNQSPTHIVSWCRGPLLSSEWGRIHPHLEEARKASHGQYWRHTQM